MEGVLGKSPLEKYWAQLETEIEGDKKVSYFFFSFFFFSFFLLFFSYLFFQSFGATFINLMETLSREKASMVPLSFLLLPLPSH